MPEPALLLRATPLTASRFARYGEVIEAVPGSARLINDGTCWRFDTATQIDVSAADGEVQVSLFRAQPRTLPLTLHSLERHPLGSQAFYPLTATPFMIVVASDGPEPVSERLRVFVSSGRQGINYRRNVWHHPLIALDVSAEFLVIDRRGPGDNCEETSIERSRIAVTC